MKRLFKHLINWWKGNTCFKCKHWRGRTCSFLWQFCAKQKDIKFTDSTCADWELNQETKKFRRVKK